MKTMSPGVAVVVGFLAVVFVATIALALTQDQIWQNVYSSADQALKVVVTP